MNPHCQIRSIRYKDKPHLLEIVPRKRTDYREIMHQHVDQICDTFNDGDMAVYSIIGIGFDGYFNSALRTHKDSPFRSALLPTALSDIQRRRIMEDVAQDVYSGRM